MKKQTVFVGCATALVTPFDGGSIDWLSYGRLIDYQLTGGADALVVCGTTGESATLTYDEQKELVAFAVTQGRGRVPIIAGAGSNNTRAAVLLAKNAESVGADALLCVTPYYNKCSSEGLYAHFEAIASAVKIPIIIYNVPSRTGMNITPSEYQMLAEIDNVAAVKEAGRDIGAFAETAYLVSGKLDMYCGNDDMLLPELSLGACGVISVVANVEPKAVGRICYSYLGGNHLRAASEFRALYPTIRELSKGVNPAPIKKLMADRGMIVNELRLPMVKMK